MIRCKVKCTETGAHQDGTHRAKFAAVYDSNANSENGQFFKYTPCMNIETGVISKQHFEAGKEYYLDFTPVENG